MIGDADRGQKTVRGFSPSESQSAFSGASGASAVQGASLEGASRTRRADARPARRGPARRRRRGTRRTPGTRQHGDLLLNERRRLVHALRAASRDRARPRRRRADRRTRSPTAPQVDAVQPVELRVVEGSRARATASSVKRLMISSRVITVVSPSGAQPIRARKLTSAPRAGSRQRGSRRPRPRRAASRASCRRYPGCSR